MNTRPSQSPDSPLPRMSPEEALLEPGGDFATALSGFRSAVNHVAERETSKPVSASWLVPAQRRQRSAQRRLILAWTCAALLCAGLLPILHHAKPVAPH